MNMIPENGIGIMDRGNACWDLIEEMSQTKTLFVIGIKTI